MSEGDMPKVLAAAHAVNEKMVALSKRINDVFGKLQADPKQELYAPMAFTYGELTLIKGSLDASVQRLRLTYGVGVEKKPPAVPEHPDLPGM